MITLSVTNEHNAIFSGVTLNSVLLKFLGAICLTLERNMFVMLATWSCQTFYAMWTRN